MAIEIVNPPGFPPLLPIYSRGVRVGQFVYTSGVAAVDLQGRTVGVNDIKAQTKCVLDAIKLIVVSGGAKMETVLQVQIFIKDFADYKDMNEVYSEYFPVDPPTRFCVRADMVRQEWLVEMAAVAYIDS